MNENTKIAIKDLPRRNAIFIESNFFGLVREILSRIKNYITGYKQIKFGLVKNVKVLLQNVKHRKYKKEDIKTRSIFIFVDDEDFFYFES